MLNVCNEEIDNLDIHFLTSHTENDIDNGPNLKTHIKSVNDTIKVHKCEICGKAFGKARDVKNHIRNVHKKFVKTGNTKMCNTCGEIFNKYENLELHIRSDHNEINEMNFTEEIHKSEIHENNSELQCKKHDKNLHSKTDNEKSKFKFKFLVSMKAQKSTFRIVLGGDISNTSLENQY